MQNDAHEYATSVNRHIQTAINGTNEIHASSLHSYDWHAKYKVWREEKEMTNVNSVDNDNIEIRESVGIEQRRAITHGKNSFCSDFQLNF